MDIIRRVLCAKTDFSTLCPQRTMLRSHKPVSHLCSLHASLTPTDLAPAVLIFDKAGFFASEHKRVMWYSYCSAD